MGYEKFILEYIKYFPNYSSLCGFSHKHAHSFIVKHSKNWNDMHVNSKYNPQEL